MQNLHLSNRFSMKRLTDLLKLGLWDNFFEIKKECFYSKLPKDSIKLLVFLQPDITREKKSVKSNIKALLLTSNACFTSK